MDEEYIDDGVGSLIALSPHFQTQITPDTT